MKYIKTNDAAEYLGLSPRTLERWRIEGTGPKFRKFGKRVLYSVEELEQWAENNRFSSTSAYIQ